MSAMDVFNADAFSVTSLTKAVNLMGYVPKLLSTKMPGLVETVPVRTRAIWIERQANQAALIQTSARGSPLAQVSGDKRDARSFNTVRLAQGSRVTADELNFIRRFGSEIDVKDMQTEVARRMFKITSNFSLTIENMLLGLVTQGKALDADGSTIYDWTVEFSGSPPSGRTLTSLSEVAFNFAAGTLGSVRLNCNAIVRGLKRNISQVGLDGDNSDIVALCGDAFYDALTTHPEVRGTFLNWTAAAELRSSVGEVWQPFRYAGVEFINYRGTDDTSLSGTKSIGVPTNNAKFFPRGAGIFQMAYSPGERFEDLNTPGQERYAMIVRDNLRDMWADVEVYSYPLPVCVLPQALCSGRLGA